MERLTVSIDPALLNTLKQQASAAGTSTSAYAARALRNEILRRQLTAEPPAEVAGWFDDAEADEPGVAGAA